MISQELFGRLEGMDVYRYTLSNENITICFINYGGAITSLHTPDRNGTIGNIVLGFNTLEGYVQDGNPYIGALVGRFGNRIAKGKFELDGNSYQLATNNMGNALHGGLRGFDKVYWNAELNEEENSISFTYHSPDGEEGYPGNLTVTVTYTLQSSELVITYHAITDRATPVNLTNHAYFNLSAGVDDTILDHSLQLNAKYFTEVTADLIPTGRLPEVANGPMDFTTEKKIGKDLSQVTGGYDHNWVTASAADLIDNNSRQLRKIATLHHESSGRLMEVFTTQPGVQFYSGNFLDGSLHDTVGATTYIRHAGLCLETQHFPDSPNQTGFPDTILRPGEVYWQETRYRFGIR